MAASANPSRVHGNGNKNNGNCSSGTQENNTNSGNVSATDDSGQTALRHNPGLSRDWTAEEQSTLEDLLAKYASESNIIRYAKIAQALQDKTVRDVALRCRWMSKKENGKRRKGDHNSKKSKDKKEKATDSLPKLSQANHCNGPPYVQSMLMESDDGISFNAIGGATGQLLEQNAHALDQISANFSAFKIHENIELFCQARMNILSILSDLSNLPELMKQMPPLPVKLNEELASSILPQTPFAKS